MYYTIALTNASTLDGQTRWSEAYSENSFKDPNKRPWPLARKLPLGNLIVEGNKLTIDVKDPEKENVAIVDTIYGAGGHVQTVTVVGSTLEEAYLKLVRRDDK